MLQYQSKHFACSYTPLEKLTQPPLFNSVKQAKDREGEHIAEVPKISC